jgi:PKHD-type hydroxylase
MINIGNHQDLAPVIPTAPTYIEDAVDRSDCLKIIQEALKGKIHTYEPENYGRFHGTFIPYSDDTAWIYGRLYDLAIEINQEAYKFEPLDMVEHIWYYEFSEGDSMNWHTDIGAGDPFSGRKLTVILNLSTSDEYRGGQLLFNNGEIMAAPRSQGSVTAFPGYLVNSTELVKSGTKKILVAWFGGGNFR